MPTLYVIEPGAQVEKEYHHLLVTKEDEVLLRVPIQQVSQVVLVGMVGITTPALHTLLTQGVPLLLVQRNGDLRGRLLPPTSSNFILRRAQYERELQEDFRLRIATAIVSAKLHNQRVLALRILRRKGAVFKEETANELKQLRLLEQKAKQSQDLESLLGWEGAGAKAYFSIYGKAFDPLWEFNHRNRRPPRDPINALLSLGYTFLTHALMSALEIAGLDPYWGIYHQEKQGRPALALDLVEEFRAPFVDSLVMGLVNRRLIKPGDFEWEPPSEFGVCLKDEALRVFLREFGDRLESEVHLQGVKKPLSYRKIFEIQAHRMARAISGEAEEYQPFLAR